jgi:RNA polymerase sigma-70 factor (ECF subfamily)
MKRMGWLNRMRMSGAGTGDAAEFERLLRPHVPTFYRSAYRWTGAVDRAEDLVQQLLVRLYPRLAELRALEQVRPWALRVMYRIFVDQVRRERSSPVQFGGQSDAEGAAAGEEDNDLVDHGAGPPELVERQLTQERIAAAWAQLGKEHRVVLSLHDIEGYSLAELSPLMDIPVGTLKSRLHRARARLRDLLATERFADSDRV